MAKVIGLCFEDRNDCTTLVLFCWSSSGSPLYRGSRRAVLRILYRRGLADDFRDVIANTVQLHTHKTALAAPCSIVSVVAGVVMLEISLPVARTRCCACHACHAISTLRHY